MKFISHPDLVGLHPGTEGFPGLGSLFHEITISLEKTLEPLGHSDLSISFFQELPTTQT